MLFNYARRTKVVLKCYLRGYVLLAWIHADVRRLARKWDRCLAECCTIEWESKSDSLRSLRYNFKCTILCTR